MEQRHLCVDQAVINFLRKEKNSGKKIILVSDFYMQSEWVKELFYAQGMSNFFNEMIVSSDVFKTKHSGKLYQHIIDNRLIDPHTTIMLGDNLYSDVKMAAKYGIKSFYINRINQRKFYDSQQIIRNSKKKCISEIEKVTKHENEEIFTYFPVLLLYIVHKLYLTCLKNKTTDLYFLSREGKIIKTLFDIYQQYLIGNKSNIKTHYLLVSRRSTFAVSLKPLYQENFHILFRQYARISIRQFALSLAFDINIITMFCKTLCIDIDELHEKPT